MGKLGGRLFKALGVSVFTIAIGMSTAQASPIGALENTDQSIQDCLGCLYKRSNFGFSSHEAAAWLVETPTGYACKYWPMTYQNSAITWNGVIPARTVALIHTHPRGKDFKPSQQDERVAQKLRVPNYVVSERGVWAAHPGAEDSEIVETFNFSQLRKMTKAMNPNSCPDKDSKTLFVWGISVEENEPVQEHSHH